MKNTMTFLALAASAAAHGWRDANQFTCPGNTDNKCTADQKSGWAFGDLNVGTFSQYKGFNWNNFECKGESNKRFEPRTSGGRSIQGSCGHSVQKSPSFGCGQTDKFSVDSFHLKPEFDTDLEFHYGMADGSLCKHRNKCSKGGSIINNTQCGGARNVTIVYPPGQKGHDKPSCSVTLSTVSFACSTQQTTFSPPPFVPTTSAAAATTHAQQVTPHTPAGSAPVQTNPVDVPSSSMAAKQTTPVVPPAQTIPPVVVIPGSSALENLTHPIQQTPVQQTPVVAFTSTSVTSYLSTSTVFQTSVHTITSCAPTVTNCPAGHTGAFIMTEVVAVSTTICPVTQTQTHIISTPIAQRPSLAGPPKVESPTTTRQTSPEATVPVPVKVPSIVPSCLNTFMNKLKCIDNTQTSCFCPDKIFIERVFDCIYGHTDNQQAIADAVQFMQGLCAAHIPANPAIATAATFTQYITATPVPIQGPATTVVVKATTVVPCTNSAGVEVASSSSTITLTQTVTAPQVDFTSSPGGGDVIPVAAAPAAAITESSPESSSSPDGVDVVPAAAPSVVAISESSPESSSSPGGDDVVPAAASPPAAISESSPEASSILGGDDIAPAAAPAPALISESSPEASSIASAPFATGPAAVSTALGTGIFAQGPQPTSSFMRAAAPKIGVNFGVMAAAVAALAAAF